MRGLLLTVVTVGALTLCGPRASAAGDTPPEIGLGAGQLLIGTATASLALGVAVAVDGTPVEVAGVLILLAGPAPVGAMVCTLGQTSKHYAGGCGPALIGAYVGALAAFPLALLGSAVSDSRFDNGDQGRNYASGTAIGFMVGYALGSAVGATIGWHRYKQERELWSRVIVPPTATRADDQRWPELRWRPAPGARGATGASVPLLAFTF